MFVLNVKATAYGNTNNKRSVGASLKWQS